METGLYVAVASNGVIGRDGDLPWRLSTDLKRFKATTMGKPVVMGRKTWLSIGKPLPGRLNIVVTRNREFSEEGVLVAESLDEALELAMRESRNAGEIAIIGGGEIFRLAMADADRLYVTHIEADVEGDTHFPRIDPQTWYPASSEAFPAGEKDSHPTRYVVYERRQAV